MTIPAVETTYAGHRFRSRLEARWAVFFDAYGVKWIYEPQGYDIGGTWYLPDFWLPGLACWVEVKGRFAEGGWDLLRASIWHLPARPEGLPVDPAAGRSTPGVLLLGEIPSTKDADRALHPFIEWGIGRERKPVAALQLVHWARQDFLMPAGVMFRAASVSLPDNLLVSKTSRYVARNEHLAAAYDKARRARFEHGEQG